MTMRKPNINHQLIYEHIEAHPGIRQAKLAHDLAMSRCAIHRAITSMEGAGYLLSQDGYKLYAERHIEGELCACGVNVVILY